MALGAAPDYVTPADGPELYVDLLVTARAFAGLSIGGRLLDQPGHGAVEECEHRRYIGRAAPPDP